MWKLLTFFLLASTAYAGSSSEESFDPASLESLEGNKLMEKFIELVEKYNMNVTIVGESKEYKKHGDLDETIAFGFTFPSNKTGPVVDKYLTKEEGQAFLDLAKEQKIVAVTNVIEVNEDRNLTSNWPKYDSDDDIYQKIVKVEDTVDGYKILVPSYRAQYNFIIPGADGKNETYMVLVANVEMNLVSNEGFSEKEVQEIQKILKSTFLTIDPHADIMDVLKSYLTELMPIEEGKGEYFVLVNPGEYYVDSVKKAEFKGGEKEDTYVIGIY